MSDVGRIQAALDDGTLLHPIDAAIPSSVDLGAALAHLAGAPMDLGPHARKLIDDLRIEGDLPQHTVFVLVDGLGCNLIDAIAPDAFFPAHTVRELRAVFPSTTAAALTSIATAAWPAQHAIPAWFTHLPELGRTAIILPFVERTTRQPLNELGVSPDVVYPHPTTFASMTADAHTYHPDRIAGSVYTAYQKGPATGEGYDSLDEVVESISGWIAAAKGRTYHYLYVPDVDVAEHEFGHGAPQVRAALERVQTAVATLAATLADLAGRTRVVISTDHGHLEVADAHKHIVEPDDPLLDDLSVPFSGEPRVPMFHVKQGHERAFEAAFRERFGHAFALLTSTEAEQLQLFGPGSLGATARARIGDYIALAPGPDVLVYQPDGNAGLRGFHAGLSPSEMRIPLILA
ncbi:MAG: alkaline phosphatase family protein [Chloroflexi bacterium]|nr:alkaline phosphatase family protein [Chloroflexota bacterium]